VVVGSIGGEEEDEMVDRSQHEMEVTGARLDPGRPVPITRLDPTSKPWRPTPAMATRVMSARRMTATMLDIQLDEKVEKGVREGANEVEHCWQFDFGDGLGGDKFGIGKSTDSRTDDDTLTSIASEETLRCQGAGAVRHCSLEEHKVGPLVMNPGPPFAVGTVINCNIGDHDHQPALVL
jgi:hypothetical protein